MEDQSWSFTAAPPVARPRSARQAPGPAAQPTGPAREQAEALQRVIDGLLGGLDLSAEQRAKVPAALTEAVRREGLL